MNDIMSFGVHRLWKKNLISWMNPQKGNKIIDVASGTGDLAEAVKFLLSSKSSLLPAEKGLLQSEWDPVNSSYLVSSFTFDDCASEIVKWRKMANFLKNMNRSLRDYTGLDESTGKL